MPPRLVRAPVLALAPRHPFRLPLHLPLAFRLTNSPADKRIAQLHEYGGVDLESVPELKTNIKMPKNMGGGTAESDNENKSMGKNLNSENGDIGSASDNLAEINNERSYEEGNVMLYETCKASSAWWSSLVAESTGDDREHRRLREPSAPAFIHSHTTGKA
ncbi:unnamed protein product, partial [Brenthis ino]